MSLRLKLFAAEKGSFLLICTLFLCLFGDVSRMSSASSTQTVNCSHRWTVYPETGVYKSQQVDRATTRRLCLEACVADPNCFSVDWDSNTDTCWKDHDYKERYSRSGLTHFEIVRRCHPASGSSHYSVLTPYWHNDFKQYDTDRDIAPFSSQVITKTPAFCFQL